jgi:hypothetical protein
LLRCYYNFLRLNRALKFGKEVRTPAMQAGLVSKRLRFRNIFLFPEAMAFFFLVFDWLAVSRSRGSCFRATLILRP